MCHLMCYIYCRTLMTTQPHSPGATEAGDQSLGPGQGLWSHQICSLMQMSAGEPYPPVGTVSLGSSLSSSPEVASAHAFPIS